MAHPNEELLRQAYAALTEGDMATFGELMADNVAWHFAGTSPISGDYESRDAVLGLLGRMAERSAGTFRLELHDVLANDEHGVGLVRAYGQVEGTELDGALVTHVFHLDDGQVTEAWAIPFDPAETGQFWSHAFAGS